MHRFPLVVALRQQRAVWEAEGMELAGPTYAEAYAARAAARAEHEYLTRHGR